MKLTTGGLSEDRAKPLLVASLTGAHRLDLAIGGRSTQLGLLACGIVLACCLVTNGCVPSVEDQCSEQKVIHVVVGKATYAIPEEALTVLTPNMEPDGVVFVSARDANGRYRRYCKGKNTPKPVVSSMTVTFPKPKPKGESFSRKPKQASFMVSRPDTISEGSRPNWLPVPAKEIIGFDYDLSKEPKPPRATITITLRLRDGSRRTLLAPCGWMTRSLKGYEGVWVGSCTPTLPVAQGNFMTVFTGGTPEADLAPLGADIVDALRRAEMLLEKR